MAAEHDVRDFVRHTEARLQAEYERIRRHAKDDPGTAGDQGEGNWAKLLQDWLPPSFPVVTKGRILSHRGDLSPQVDVLVLLPTYPSILLGNKHYLAAGVVAAFECKITLKAKHIEKSVATACSIARMIPRQTGTPSSELRPPIAFGVLAHSHSWKARSSTSGGRTRTTTNSSGAGGLAKRPARRPRVARPGAVENVTTTLWEADEKLGAALGEVTAAAAIGDHRELGAGRDHRSRWCGPRCARSPL